jgi:hypothetical protein
MPWRLCYAKTDRVGGPFEADGPEGLWDTLLPLGAGRQAGLEVDSPSGDDWIGVEVLAAGTTPEALAGRCGHLFQVGSALDGGGAGKGGWSRPRGGRPSARGPLASPPAPAPWAPARGRGKTRAGAGGCRAPAPAQHQSGYGWRGGPLIAVSAGSPRDLSPFPTRRAVNCFDRGGFVT